MERADALDIDGAARLRARRPFPGLVAACSSFAIQYNYGSASVAVAVMTSHRDVSGGSEEADYPEPEWADRLLLSSVFAGSVIGMLVMGYLGDLVGVPKALVVTNSLIVAGALTTSLLAWGSGGTVWIVIAAARLVLGIGVGGNYPLTAAKASRAAQTPAEATAKAAGAFFWQAPGCCAPYVLLLLLLLLPPAPGVTSWQFRILFGVGAIPALVVLVGSFLEARDSPRSVTDCSAASLSPAVEAIPSTRSHWWKLLGTGGAWFFYDISAYGVVIFQPTILSSIFGASQTLVDLGWQGALLQLLGVAGTAMGFMALDVLGPKMEVVLGFVVTAAGFVMIMAVFRFAPNYHYTQFALLSLVTFAINSLPNVGTYVLPVYAFPQEVRSTFHGLSASAGKVGAMVGTAIFPFVDEVYGMTGVMAVETLACVIGALLSWRCI